MTLLISLSLAAASAWLPQGGGGTIPAAVHSSVTERLETAEAKLKAEDYRSAVRELELALDAGDEHPEVRRKLRLVRARLDEEFQRRLDRAATFMSGGHFDEAASEYERALSLKPSESSARALLVAARRRASRPADRSTLTQRLISEGREFARSGRYEDALAALQTAEEIEPENVEVKVWRTLVQAEKSAASDGPSPGR